MRVTLLSNINHDGRNYEDGSVVDVPEELAQKWIEIGAAKENDGEGGASELNPFVATAPSQSEQTVQAVAPQEPPVPVQEPETPAVDPTPEQIAEDLRQAGLDSPQQPGNPFIQ